MWGVEPDEIAEIPVKIEEDFGTPVIQKESDHEQFEMLMTLVNNGMTTIAQAMEKRGIRDILFAANSSRGWEGTPANQVWPANNNNTNNKYENDKSFGNQPINFWGQFVALTGKDKKFITETVNDSDKRPVPLKFMIKG